MERPDQERLSQDVEAFCQAIRPLEERCYLERLHNEDTLALASQHNLLGMPIPPEYGGRGADNVSYARALARIGREGNAVRTFFSGQTSIGQYPILAWGNADQKQRYLPPSVQGDVVLAFGLTEPEAGSNPREMQMTYRRDDDRFLLNGEKYLITNGGIANVAILFAYPEGGAGRISAFIVETAAPGFAREELFPKMGMHTVTTARFALTDCPVPATNLLGSEGDGLRIAMTTLISGRLSVAAGCLGVIEDCLVETVAYAKQRHQHGKAIARHQLVQEHIATIELARVTTEAVVLQAAAAKDASDAEPTDSALRSRADLLVAEAKLYASQAAWDAADRAVQVFGGRGYLEQFRPARHLQDVRVCRLYEGTDEILKLKIAAAVLGKEYEAYH
ncbi:MAG TPA: acyl-CoA dehydrogenase family protein [Isosphaeraceae bacterium]|jgi:alkylation response protein AidB-like acyl-CoA dehydrogenase|nr:acyl-CoA dehydrogenase family protein [Isosphaeraceae bacterium]